MEKHFVVDMDMVMQIEEGEPSSRTIILALGIKGARLTIYHSSQDILSLTPLIVPRVNCLVSL
jgi:hypothetical protein